MTTKRVLIVDDEPKVAFFLGRSLKHVEQGCEVLTARSGEEALEILNAGPIDLLITDLRMPGISGIDLIRWVRASNPKSRTILMTAYGNDQIESEAHRLEVYRYITKPFNVQQFTSAVEGALRDLAVSTPGLVVFSGETFEVIAQRLETLRYDTSARCIFFADMQGQRLVEVGETGGIDSTMLLTLLAGGFATSAELARQFGDTESVNLTFYEGQRYDIYAANVGQNLIVAMVYDRRVQKSRVGMVWLYLRRAIEDLAASFADGQTGSSSQTLDDDFGSSLLAELDSAFAGKQEEVALSHPTQSASALLEDPPSSSSRIASPRERLPEPRGGKEDLLPLEEAVKRGLIPPDLLAD